MGGMLFSKEMLKNINYNIQTLKHNTFYIQGESYFRDYYISKYPDPEMSYEEFLVNIIPLVLLPSNKKALENNEQVKKVLRDPWRARSLLTNLFKQVDEINSSNISFKNNVGFIFFSSSFFFSKKKKKKKKKKS